MPVLRALECDIRIEHHGRELHLKGSEGEFRARFPTLASLLHFLRLGWRYRHALPGPVALRVEWKSLSFRVPAGR